MHAKLGPKGGYKGKYNMEASNGEGPFKNVEEGPNISTFKDYIMLKNRLLMVQK